MVSRIYTPAEVADILQVDKEVVMRLIHNRRLPAFQVNGLARITEEQVREFIENNPYHAEEGEQPSPAASSLGRSGRGRQRNRNVEAERTGREWAIEQIKQVAPDLWVNSRKTHFIADGKEGLVRTATVPDPYWFGFPDKFLASQRPTVLVLVMADRPLAIVMPCDKFKHVLEGLSMDSAGQRKLNVKQRAGSYYLIGKGIDEPLPLDRYVNAFDLLS